MNPVDVPGGPITGSWKTMLPFVLGGGLVGALASGLLGQLLTTKDKTMKLTDLERMALALVIALTDRVKEVQESAEQSIKLAREIADKAREDLRKRNALIAELFPSDEREGSKTVGEIHAEIVALREAKARLDDYLKTRETLHATQPKRGRRTR